MKHKLCTLAKHILLGGTLFPLAICGTYIALLCRSGVTFSHDLTKAALEVGETIALCVLVAVGGSLLADAAWKDCHR